MMREPVEPRHVELPADRVRVMVTVERPPVGELAGQDRGAKYDALSSNSANRRDDILRWLGERGLANEVYEAGEPTAFNVLFLTTSPRVAELLRDAPGVLAVEPAPEFELRRQG